MTYSTLRLLLFGLILLALSGCATQSNPLSLLDFRFADTSDDIALSDDENRQAPPEELRPQPIEADTDIAQELDELRKTGSWSIKTRKPAETEEEKYDFPVVVNKQVEMYLNLFQTKQRRYYKRWLCRSTRYKDIIHAELEKAGLPKDLLYLAMIESGFNQRAYSKAKAVGLWQFMRGTGRDYDLRVDRYVDERRHALKSTRAAVAFLGDLHQQFGDWHLAVAAYNAGAGKIRSGLRKYKTNDFWTLAEKKHLRLETKRYVPKLIAAIIIAKDPEKYGFTDLDYETPLEFDQIEVGPGLSLDALALICGGPKKQVRLLNQELKTGKTPLNKRKYVANIPKGTKEIAKKGLNRLHRVAKTKYKTHIIKKKETLASICRKYRLTKKTILKVNNLRTAKLRPGQRLRIPYTVVEYVLLPEKDGNIAQTGHGLILHNVKRGETIGSIARKYAVPINLIVAWNGLKNAHSIREGQKLALYIVQEKSVKTLLAKKKNKKGSTPQESATVVSTDKPQDNHIVLTEKRKKSPQKVAVENVFSWYQVKSGDTLWKISRRFKISPQEIRSWNNLKSNTIHPGVRLRLKGV